MKSWSTQKAQARLDELLDVCEREGPQLLTRGGEEVAVLVSVAEWRRLSAGRPTLKELLLAPHPRCDSLTPPRRGE